MNTSSIVNDNVIEFSNSNNITEERNDRIFIRNLKVGGDVEYHYGIHPVSTKYSIMPIFDHRIPSDAFAMNADKNNYTSPQTPYNINATFLPCTTNAPWSGFSNNVYTESLLRNQFFALQHGSPRSAYIPDSNSDLYNYTMGNSADAASNSTNQPFPLLFKPTVFEQGNKCPTNMGTDFFNNCTRYQIGEINVSN